MTVIDQSPADFAAWPPPPATPLLLLEARALPELAWFFQCLPLLRR